VTCYAACFSFNYKPLSDIIKIVMLRSLADYVLVKFQVIETTTLF
jgi:hypothetical protein